MKLTTKSKKETILLGQKIATKLQGGEVVALIGELGAGKTTLIKGIAKGLGIKKIITSPTFVLMKIYNVKNKAIRKIIHIDCYRLKQPSDILAIGANEYFKRKDSIVLIEWADKIKKILPEKIITCKISLIKEDQRRYDITGLININK